MSDFPLGYVPAYIRDLDEKIRAEKDPVWRREKIELKKFILHPEKSKYRIVFDDGKVGFDSWQCLIDQTGSEEAAIAFCERFA